MRPLPFLALLTALACRDFAVPPPPAPDASQVIPVTVTPGEAYAGQGLRIALGAPVDLSQVQVLVAGRLADRPGGVADGGLAATVPTLDGVCSESLLVQLDSPGKVFGSTTVRYLGAGHPGRPRPQVSRIQPVTFTPTSLATTRDTFVASGYGELVALLDSSDLSMRQVVHAKDFVVGLAGQRSSERLCQTFATAGQTGAIEGFALLRANTITGGKILGIPQPSLFGSLRSPIAQSPSFASLPPVGCESKVDGLVVLPTPSGRVMSVVGDPDAGVVTTLAEPVTSFAQDDQTLVAPLFDSHLVLARGGTAPQIGAATASGDMAGVLPLAADEASWTPTAIAQDFGFVVASMSSTSGQARLVLLQAMPPDGGTGPQPKNPPDAGPGAPLSGAVVGDYALDGPLISLAVGRTDSTVFVFGVDGVESTLRIFTVSPSGTSIASETRASLPEPGLRVEDTLGPVALVAGPSGLLTTLDSAGNVLSGGRVHAGSAAISPLMRASCETPAALVAAAALSSSAVVPTARGTTRAAFLQGLPAATCVDAVSLGRDGGADLTFVAGSVPVLPDAGPETGDAGFIPGLVVSQTATQIDDLGGSQAKATPFDFATRAALFVTSFDSSRAFVLAGGPKGILRVPVSPGALPTSDDGQLDSTCTFVRQLVPLLDRDRQTLRAAALAGDGAICLIDALAPGPHFSVARHEPGTLPVAKLAGAFTRGSDGLGQLRLFAAGWRTRASGQPELVLSHASGASLDAAALGEIQLSGGVRQRLPTGGVPITAMAASPDGRRLLLGFGGDHPGVFSVDPLALLDPGASDDERIASMASISLDATPLGFSFTEDGAMAAAVLADDTLAIIE